LLRLVGNLFEPVTYSSWKVIETPSVFSFQHHAFSSCDIPKLINNSEWEVNQLPLTGKRIKECVVLNAGFILMMPATDLLYMVVTFQEDGDEWDI
jgi:hypothetical protein